LALGRPAVLRQRHPEGRARAGLGARDLQGVRARAALGVGTLERRPLPDPSSGSGREYGLAGRGARCGFSSPAAPASSVLIWRSASCATLTTSSSSTTKRP